MASSSADQARGDVDAAAGGEAGDDFRRPRRIIECGRRSRQGGHSHECAGKFEEIPAKQKFHVERPLLAASYPNCGGPSKAVRGSRVRALFSRHGDMLFPHAKGAC